MGGEGVAGADHEPSERPCSPPPPPSSGLVSSVWKNDLPHLRMTRHEGPVDGPVQKYDLPCSPPEGSDKKNQFGRINPSTPAPTAQLGLVQYAQQV